jgi:hypothetical protein
VSSSRFKLNDTEAPSSLKSKGSTKCSSRNTKKTKNDCRTFTRRGPCVNDARNTGRKNHQASEDEITGQQLVKSQQELQSRAVLEKILPRGQTSEKKHRRLKQQVCHFAERRVEANAETGYGEESIHANLGTAMKLLRCCNKTSRRDRTEFPISREAKGVSPELRQAKGGLGIA